MRMSRIHGMAAGSPAFVLLVFVSTACAVTTAWADGSVLDEFARRCAAAWSSQDPEALAATDSGPGGMD